MRQIRFMRIILFFDLPTKTINEQKEYTKFVKVLKGYGFIRMQYSVYTRLCIDASVAKRLATNIRRQAPNKGDIRYLIVTEKQYQSIVDLNSSYTFREKVISADRLLIIGGINGNREY